MTNKGLGPKIRDLRDNGYTYDQIKDQLKCSKATICYHIGEGQKLKAVKKQQNRRNKVHPFDRKLENFKLSYKKPIKIKPIHHNKKMLNLKLQSFSRVKQGTKYMNTKLDFTTTDVINKFSNNQKCYLTGDEIDITKPRTYAFDHKIPRSRGGENTLDNLELATKQANLAKSDMTPDEFYNFCKKVLEHQGYKVIK